MTQTRTVYSTQDDGAGTLRDALRTTASYTSEWIDAGALENGDVVDFSDELEEDGVITIYLDSQLGLPTKDLTIDGGSYTGSGATLATRVILDAQQLGRIVNGASANKIEIYNVTFKSGQLASGVYGACVQMRNSTASGANVFENCVFKQAEAGSGGGVYSTSSSQNTFNNCTFGECSATGNGGAVYSYNTSQNTFNKCTFDGCSATYGGVVFSTSTSQNTFNKCTFDGCSATYGGAVCIYGTSQNTLTNCVFIPPENNTKATIYNNGTNTEGSLIINGSTTCDHVQFVADSTNVINGNLTADVLTINNGASVTFSSVDSVLAATATATIGSATFTAAEGATGYIALPAGTPTPTVGENVIVGEYGADVSAISASISENVATIDVSAGAPSKTYIVEASSDGGETWTQIALVDKKTTLASAKAYIFRTFDGHFVTTNTIPRVYYYNGSPTAGSFATAADWALDEARTIVCPDSPTIAGGVFYCV